MKRLNQIDTYGHDPKDLAKVIGLKSRVLEIKSRKRPMSTKIIRKFRTTLSIPADVLMEPYEIVLLMYEISLAIMRIMLPPSARRMSPSS